MMEASSTLEAPTEAAEAEARAALGEGETVADLAIPALVNLVKGDDTPAELAADAMAELESRADDDIEEAQAALQDLDDAEPPVEAGEESGPDVAGLSTAQLITVVGGEGEPFEGLGEVEVPAAIAALEERAEEGDEDAVAALAKWKQATPLPTAADDDGNDVDLSAGIELQLPGLEGGLKLSFQGIGGKRPEESEFRVVGGGFKVPGQFEKGQDVFIELRTRVTEVAFSDVIDNKTAQATTSKRKHKGRVIGAVVIEQSAIEKLQALTDAVHGLIDGTVSLSVLAGIVGRDDDPDSLPVVQHRAS